MTDQEKALDNQIPYDRHPLYQEITQQLADGDEAEAIANLERLAELYPEEQFIQDMLLRLRLRTTFEETEHIPVNHRRPSPILRLVMIFLLLISICLVGAVVALALGFGGLRPPEEDLQPLIDQTWNEYRRVRNQGDWIRTEAILDTLASLTPGDPVIQEERQFVEQQKTWANLYADALVAMEAGDWDGALEPASQIPPDSFHYNRAQRLIGDLKDLNAWEEAWLEAEGLLAIEDWQGAISILTWIRTQNPQFRRSDVEGQLFQIHALLASQQLEQAGGNLNTMRQAIAYLSEALRYRPTDQALVEERRLAIGFVAGGESFEHGEWARAASRWEPVYETRPDYQDGVLKKNLYEAYPLAAKDLIARANGSIKMLAEAIGYLDRTLAARPGEEALEEERLLAVEYLSGLEAFAQEKWNLAIVHWGPIYALRPDYQNGLLEENLRLACASSSTPDEELCPP